MTLRAEAENPETTPARLRELVRRGHGRAVAGNPNTPPDLLLKLAAHHFDAFAANPVLPLLLLEDPGFCLRIPALTLRRLLRRVDLPPAFLQTLQRHPNTEVRDAARLHVGRANGAAAGEQPQQAADAVRALRPSRGAMPELLDHDLAPAWLLEPLVGSANPRLRDDVLSALGRSNDPAAAPLRDLYRRAGAASPRPDEPVQTSAEMAPSECERLAAGGAWAQRIAAAHPCTPEAALRRLATAGSLAVQLIALHHPYLPEDVLWSKSGSARVEVRRAIVGNPRVPEALLARLADDPAPEVRRAVALHPTVPAETLKRLAGDPDAEVRRRIARHRMTPPHILEQLAADADAEVREFVARHSQTPAPAIERLLGDTVEGVRAKLARRRDLTDEWLLRLLLGPDDEAQFWATYSWAHSEALRSRLINAEGRREEIIAALARYPRKPRRAPPPKPRPRVVRFRLPVRYYHEPYDSSDSDKHAAALSGETPPEELDRLAETTDRCVLSAVAGNANTPPETLARLLRKPGVSWRVFHQVAHNANTPAASLEWLASLGDEQTSEWLVWNKSLPVALLEKFASDPSAKVRLRVAQCERTPAAVLERLALEENAEIRAGLAANASTPLSIIEQLAVRAARTPSLREALARNLSLPRVLIEQFLHDPSDEVRLSLAHNKSLTAADVEILSRDPDPAIQRQAASHPNAPVAVLAAGAAADDEAALARLALASDDPAQLIAWAAHPSAKVRTGVAHNKNAPAAALEMLAQDPELNIRRHLLSLATCPASLLASAIDALPGESTDVYYVLRCPALTPAQWERLARHESEKVRIATAAAATAPEIQMLFLEDKAVWFHLVRNKNLAGPVMDAIVAQGDRYCCHLLALRYGTPLEIVKVIVRNGKLDDFYAKQTRAIVAARADIDREFLIEMAQREIPAYVLARRRRSSRWTRRKYEDDLSPVYALLRRTEIPIEVFEPLIDHHDQGARRELLRRPDLPAEWRTRLRAGALQRALHGAALFARVAALAHAETPPDDLEQSVNDGRWIERYAVARNPAAPRDLLLQLADDANVLVRAAAHERLGAAAPPLAQ